MMGTGAMLSFVFGGANLSVHWFVASDIYPIRVYIYNVLFVHRGGVAQVARARVS